MWTRFQNFYVYESAFCRFSNHILYPFAKRAFCTTFLTSTCPATPPLPISLTYVASPPLYNSPTKRRRFYFLRLSKKRRRLDSGGFTKRQWVSHFPYSRKRHRAFVESGRGPSRPHRQTSATKSIRRHRFRERPWLIYYNFCRLWISLPESIVTVGRYAWSKAVFHYHFYLNILPNLPPPSSANKLKFISQMHVRNDQFWTPKPSWKKAVKGK